jgi:hypothetical protein
VSRVVIGSARPHAGLRAPRTTEEAFGPGHRLTSRQLSQSDRVDGIIGAFCGVFACGFSALVVLTWLGVL